MRRILAHLAPALILALLAAPPASALDLKQGGTGVKIPFLMTLASDHTTPATGLSPTVTLSKNGATFAAPGGTVAEVGNGWYALTPNAADTGTLGDLALHATAGTADPADRVATVVAYDPTDATIGLNAAAYPASPAAGTWGSAVQFLDAKVGRRGVAQAGTTTSITLDAAASGTDNTYKDHFIKLTLNTGAGQWATITSYNGTTKVAQIVRPSAGGSWSTTPDSTTAFLIEPIPVVDLMASQSFNNTGQVTAPADSAGTTTLLSRVTAAVALASQIPAAFTSGTFASPGVFATAALANGPTGGGGGSGSTLVVVSGTVTASTSASSFTATLSANAPGSAAAYVKRKVVFQSGVANQQRGTVLSAVVTGSAGAYTVTFTMNPAVDPAVQVTPAANDTFELY